MRSFLRLVFRPVALFWKALSAVRRFAGNLVFLLVIAAIGVLAFTDRGGKVPHGAVLVFEPQGRIVEQASEALFADTIAGQSALSEIPVRDVVEGIDQAAKDARIKGILLSLGRLESAGLSKLQEIGAALARFRASGKFVVARATLYSQRDYYLAAHADRVYLHPMGLILLTGFGAYQNYYRTALESLKVRVHIFKVGSYKSALEPYTRDDMSAFDREANTALLAALWGRYTADVAACRGIGAAAVDDYVGRLPAHLAAAGGDAARVAVELRLVDGLKTADEVDAELAALVGTDPQTHKPRQVGLLDYLAAVRREKKPSGADKVAVVVAQGMIRDGLQPPGSIGGESLSSLIRRAREDRAAKALVVRIDSPGGSAFASELIRREIELTRLSGKPVVVSMSSVAASGGYWIASAADEIWAYPTTVTGSIGIFGAFPTFEESLKALGIRNDGVGTTPLADAFNPFRPMNAQAAEALQQLVEQGYRTFLQKVVDGRRLSFPEVERIAQGRIWAGETAAGLGLVDRLGFFQDAVQAAAARAGLADYRVETVEPELSARDKLARTIGKFFLAAAPGVREFGELARALGGGPWPALPPLDGPRGLQALCLDCPQP
jgi:protease-4